MTTNPILLTLIPRHNAFSSSQKSRQAWCWLFYRPYHRKLGSPRGY